MLTEEQLELWNLVAPEDVTARDGQSLLQARLSAVVGFILACQFDGVPAPTEQEARAELARRLRRRRAISKAEPTG
jgi:hypothetical protein